MTRGLLVEFFGFFGFTYLSSSSSEASDDKYQIHLFEKQTDRAMSENELELILKPLSSKRREASSRFCWLQQKKIDCIEMLPEVPEYRPTLGAALERHFCLFFCPHGTTLFHCALNDRILIGALMEFSKRKAGYVRLVVRAQRRLTLGIDFLIFGIVRQLTGMSFAGR